jgi:ABC-type branched-subunit amino acid transport system substrate-binding protein
MNWKSMNLLYCSDAYGATFAQAFSSAVISEGLNVIEKQVFTPGTSNVTSILQVFQQTSARIMVLAGPVLDCIFVLRQAR